MSVAVVKDASGCSIENIVDIDGNLLPMFAGTPEKTVEKMRTLHDMPIRDSDVILNTYPKAGTHWGFEILTMLLQGNTERKPTDKNQLWLELASPSDLEQQPSPRVLNSHMQRLALYPRQIREKRNKMVVIMRNPKDVAVSFYHQTRAAKKLNYNGKFEDFLVNFMDGRVLYGSWFDYTLDIEKAAEKKDFNMHIVYFENLKDYTDHSITNYKLTLQNGAAEIQKIARFLEVNAEEELCNTIAEACAFDKMKTEKERPKEQMEKMFRGNYSLFRKGIIGDWKNYFTVAQSEAFDRLFAEKMAASKFKFRFEAM